MHIAALLEDSMSDRPFWPRRSLNIVANGLRLRSHELRNSRHRLLACSSTSLVVLVGIVAFATNGFGLTSGGGPTKGPLPHEVVLNPNNGDVMSKIPDFVSAIDKAGKVVGYVPKQSLFHSPSGSPIEPVYASDLKTLVGHMYPGVGYVPLSKSPSSQPCLPESSNSNGVILKLACPSTIETIPNVVGMFTPDAAVKLSELSLSIQIVNVHTSAAPLGHILTQSPPPGTSVHARSVVIITNNSRAGGSSVPYRKPSTK